MTLKPYNADELDQLALRILDISHDLRQISLTKRKIPGLNLAMHEKKALEWIAQLERWAADALTAARTRLDPARGSREASRFSE